MADETQPAESMNSTGASPPGSPRESRLLRSAIWRGLIAFVLVGVVFWGAFYFTREHHGPEAREATAPAASITAGVLTVRPRDVPLTTQFLAQTEPSATVPIRARVSGFLVDRSFEEGQAVERDQLLFRIDPAPFEVALRQAEAGLQAAEAQLLRADQQVMRFQNLAELQQAAANELEQAQESQRIAAASVETQRALIEQARLDLGYTTIKSPIAGVIGVRQQDVGSYIGPGTETLLATVRTVDPLYVRFSVSEQDILRWQRLRESGLVTDVPLDQLAVGVILPDGRAFPHVGRIDFVDVAVDPSTGTAVVRAIVPNPEHKLFPGQFVHVNISGITRIGAIIVPQSAVLQTPGGASVYVVDDAGLAQTRPVTAGSWIDDGWLIESGLRPGDRVIVDSLMQVRPGTRISPIEPVSEQAPGQTPGQ